MAADENCVSYGCECNRLAALTDDAEIRNNLLELARLWIAMREKEYSGARVTPQGGQKPLESRRNVEAPEAAAPAPTEAATTTAAGSDGEQFAQVPVVHQEALRLKGQGTGPGSAAPLS